MFGFRALVLTVFIAAIGGLKPAVDCLEQQDYTELLFEFVILELRVPGRPPALPCT